jgi:transcription elongation GreA/GreB family factor
MSSLKELLHQRCLASVEKRIAATRQSMADAHQSGLEETKSSSGDKYETGRAMMHLEMEKLSAQLAEAEKLKNTLLNINPSVVFEKAQTGSLVLTTQGNYYISVSTGSFSVEGKTFVSISAASPLGSKLIGLKKGSEFVFNGKSIRIEQID